MTVKVAVPSPSFTAILSIAKLALSLSVIEPTPCASAIVTRPFEMFDKFAKNVSVASAIPSSVIGTVKVCVSPLLPAKVKVSVVDV